MENFLLMVFGFMCGCACYDGIKYLYNKYRK